jgi:FkbH-like protein
MLLREEDIAVFQANWEDKASNVHAIAAALDLGLESLAFVDDNAAERARVRQMLPLVSVPEMGDEPAFFPNRIADSGIFDHLLLTHEDMSRHDTYRSRAAALELRSKIGDYDEYLQSLAMSIRVEPFSGVDRARITQLINRSNQFNLTTRRYNEAQVRLFEENHLEFRAWQVRMEDIFGKQGIIAVLIIRKTAQTWTIDSWCMSCRVLGRGVEETMANFLMAQARQAGIEWVVGEYLPTERNAIVADLYPRLGFQPIDDDAPGRRFRASPSTHRPLPSFIETGPS